MKFILNSAKREEISVNMANRSHRLWFLSKAGAWEKDKQNLFLLWGFSFLGGLFVCIVSSRAVRDSFFVCLFVCRYFCVSIRIQPFLVHSIFFFFFFCSSVYWKTVHLKSIQPFLMGRKIKVAYVFPQSKILSFCWEKANTSFYANK